MQIQVVTLFPEMVSSTISVGICGRALARGLAAVGVVNPRDFAGDLHKTVDDRPYGGGPGMVLRYQPLRAAVRHARSKLPPASRTVFLSPQGRRFDEDLAQQMVAWPGLVLVAGRYEGLDQRLIDAEAEEEISIGDFVLSGGEIAALAVIDALVRLLPGALGDGASAQQDSFMGNLLDCPHFTRPECVDGRLVPEILLQGDHAAVRRWRLREALGRTFLRRPEVLARRQLSGEERALLREYLESGRASVN